MMSKTRVEFVGTVGGRYHVSDRVALSLGISYDNDHAVEIHPGPA